MNGNGAKPDGWKSPSVGRVEYTNQTLKKRLGKIYENNEKGAI